MDTRSLDYGSFSDTNIHLKSNAEGFGAKA